MIFKQAQTIARNLIQTQWKENSLPHIIIGLSGGPDSVFLLLVLNTLRNDGIIHLTAAHLNHGWRPTSNNDVLFCKKVADLLKIPIIVMHADQLSATIKKNGSQEAYGRALRRIFFEQVRKKNNADYIALAHHLNDQQETFFTRLARGTSLDGLTCMKPIEYCYLRPLLSLSKDEILTYLHAHSIEYVTDETNQSDDFLRNRIRKYVIPALDQCDERFSQKLASTMHNLTAENEFINSQAHQAFNKIFYLDSTIKRLQGNCSLFNITHDVLKNRIILQWLIQEQVPFAPSKKLILEIIRFVATDRGGRHELNTSWAVVKKQNIMWIERIQA